MKLVLALEFPPDEGPIARSQARRLLAAFDRSRELTLDFRGVSQVESSFADEVFRVFPDEHPEVRLRWVNASSGVERRIERALGAGRLAEEA